ncbi:MAG: hypothetical protein WD749_15345 [Phycisphaerales bacterium]
MAFVLAAGGGIAPGGAHNRGVCAQFFEFQEYKLKRQNGLPELDEGCLKTLYGYIQYLRNTELWFKGKPWAELTKEDIKRVYDDLEDGTIRTQRGGPVQNRVAYYNKIFKGKPFRLIGKDALAREVIEYSNHVRPPVRFVTEETFRRLVSAISGPEHLLLAWLAWDIGENIDSLLKLTARDFALQANRYTGEREYVIHLAATKLKRSRQTRSEVTLYPETARYADLVLMGLAPNDLVFPCGYRAAAKFLGNAVRRTRAVTMPNSDPVRWKDLRSGMACHLLRCGWTRDEVNARLGHTPHSDALDAYINFLALDREAPKQRMLESAAHSRVQSIRTPVSSPPTPGVNIRHSLPDQSEMLREELDSLRRQVQMLVQHLAR